MGMGIILQVRVVVLGMRHDQHHGPPRDHRLARLKADKDEARAAASTSLETVLLLPRSKLLTEGRLGLAGGLRSQQEKPKAEEHHRRHDHEAQVWVFSIGVSKVPRCSLQLPAQRETINQGEVET